MIHLFNQPLASVPQVWVDTETTGIRKGQDRAVQVAFVRVEAGAVTGEFSSLVNPGMPIGAEAAAVHGITDEMVRDAPPLAEACHQALELIEGAQPGAYNAEFDRWFVPGDLFDPSWPWLDSLTLVRKVDRYAKGRGRHKLGAVCKRHGIQLSESEAHDALPDARAAGQVWAKLWPQCEREVATNPSLGQVLGWLRRREAEQWADFHQWLANRQDEDRALEAERAREAQQQLTGLGEPRG